jgi:hypothetical protein
MVRTIARPGERQWCENTSTAAYRRERLDRCAAPRILFFYLRAREVRVKRKNKPGRKRPGLDSIFS